MPKQVKFPANCNTEASRLSFCYRLQAVLTTEHNAKGVLYRNEDITKEEWEAYLQDVFFPKMEAVNMEVSTQKGAAKNGAYWNPNTNTDIIDGI